jgi:hypothetical protein
MICCDRRCDGSGETCIPDGICREPAPAPALGPRGLALSVLALLLASAAAFRRLRRET